MGSKFIRFAILISLIGGLPHSNGDNVELEAVEYESAKGMSMQHSLPLDVLTEVMKECTLITPTGETFELYPNENITDPTIQFDEGALWPKCGIKIGPLTTNHIGKWILQGLYDVNDDINNEETEKTVIQEIQLKVIEEFTESEAIITSTRGAKIHHEMPTRDYLQKLVTCTLKTNKGIYYELYPTSNITDDNIEFYPISLISLCGIEIENISEEYLGKWELKAILNNPDIIQIQELEIRINEKVSTIPATASVYEGSDVSVALSEVAKNHKCTWISPTGQEIIVDTVDTCNLKLINVTMKDSGTWTGLSEGDITLFGNFYLSVKEIDIIEETQVLKLGRSSELTFGPSDSTFCFVISPMGETFPHNTGVCKINIDKVTNKHHGIWQAHVNLPGKLNSVVYYYNIKIEELDLEQLNDQKVISSFSSSTNDIQMSCSMIVDSLKSCHLIRSDGKLLSIYDGVGYEQYTGFSKSEKLSDDRTAITCGLIVNNPTEADMKNWKCLIVHGDDNKESSTTIKISESTEIESTKNIEIVKGSTYDLKCSLQSKINYCWFLSPSGAQISLYKGVTAENYEYYGNGLDVGDCGIKVKKASTQDSGTWKCNMGTEFYSDLQASIDVKVHENVLIPIHKTALIAVDLTIGCKTFDKTPVDYCRFVRPDGKGFNPSGNYSTYGAGKTSFENGICEIQIFKPSYNDLGIWRCAAKSIYEEEEYHSAIYVVQYYYWVSYSPTLYTIMWVILTLTVTLLIAILCTSNRGKHIRRRTVELTRSFSIRKENIHTPE